MSRFADISDDFAASERNRVVTVGFRRWRLLQDRIAQEAVAHILDILADPEFSEDQYAAQQDADDPRGADAA